ncbi:TRAFAC clade GTPase domain-containing protein [Deinococcus misasensis]|uniref:TRAFAC clade GTPase domain-containing protein n=1 Tax=Deinococcus misasensis TaxID=392413 RepID=UPI00054CF78D|nr:hypothetical protein [Deinococcus misasensis]
MERLVCKQKDCTFNTQGICLEGLAITDCSFIVEEDFDDTNDTGLSIEELENLSFDTEIVYDLHKGRAFSYDEVRNLLKTEDCKIIVFAGDAESGKTTLMASLNDAFQHGKFENFIFAGSLTLPAFEERCFNARISSKGGKPSTPRTRLTSTEIFLHLKIRDKEVSYPPVSLLLCDLSGELFINSISDLEHAKSLMIVEKANHFSLLLDGEKIMDKSQRHLLLSDTKDIIRVFFQIGYLKKETPIEFIITKWDLIPIDKDPKIGEYIEFLYKDLIACINDFTSSSNITFVKTAARSIGVNEVEDGFGLENLISLWSRKEQSKSVEKIEPYHPKISALRGWLSFGARKVRRVL